MNVISIEEFRQGLDQYLAENAATDIILTRQGKPCFHLRVISANGIAPEETPEYAPESFCQADFVTRRSRL